jgi:hypothetical protein
MKGITCLLWLAALAAFGAGASCGDEARVGSGGSGGATGGSGGGPGPFIALDAAISLPAWDSGTGEANVCKTEQVTAKLEPTRLAFALDVSGSMGAGDYPWHDITLKWDPVVAAIKGFFSDPSSQGIEASLVFFPTEDEDTECDADVYETPDVPMTALPSPVFGDAIDAESPDRSGTPTLAVAQSIIAYIRAQQAIRPGKYVLVLVTDGYPQGCGDTNNITNTASAVAAPLAEGISTYVIGVKNPPLPDAPDVTSNLTQIASAGGTTAIFVDTGTPATTQQAFAAAIDQIRGASIICDMPIPEPPAGLTFDKKKVIVTYTSGANAPLLLSYDATCAGTNAWHYDDPITPTRVVLCPSTCTTIQADPDAVLNVGFTCEQVITVIP